MARPASSAALIERDLQSAMHRKAELLASDPTVHRYGDLKPEDGRDVYSIYMHRESHGGGYVAHLWPWDLEQRYRVTYGAHDPESLWSYEAPAGAKEVYGC
jgi:hypothetical protein